MSRGLDLDLATEMAAQSETQKEIQASVLELEKELDTWLAEMCSINVTLRDKVKARAAIMQETARPQMPPMPPSEPTLVQPPVAQTTPTPAQPVPVQASAGLGEDYKASIEKLLQGSIDSLGDKLSEKILGLLKELKTMGGPMREYKMSELQHAAQSEHVDLASLFLHEKVESNLGSEGLKVEETKGTGIGSILDKLKKMKGGK